MFSWEGGWWLLPLQWNSILSWKKTAVTPFHPSPCPFNWEHFFPMASFQVFLPIVLITVLLAICKRRQKQFKEERDYSALWLEEIDSITLEKVWRQEQALVNMFHLQRKQEKTESGARLWHLKACTQGLTSSSKAPHPKALTVPPAQDQVLKHMRL